MLRYFSLMIEKIGVTRGEINMSFSGNMTMTIERRWS